MASNQSELKNTICFNLTFVRLMLEEISFIFYNINVGVIGLSSFKERDYSCMNRTKTANKKKYFLIGVVQ